MKYINEDGSVIPVTAGEYLDMKRPSEVVSLPEGSWGEGGYHWIWLNDMNKWTWKHVYEAENKMKELATAYAERKDDPEFSDIVKQAGRELFLLQSSDWQFLISDQRRGRITPRQGFRAITRTSKKLAELADKKLGGIALNEGEKNSLQIIMERDNLFPDIDPLWFKEVEFAPAGA